MALDDRQIRPPSFSAMVGIVIGISVLIFISASVVIVPAGERAVIFDNFQGVLDDVRGEGMTFVLPFVQKAIRYDVKTQTYSLGESDNEGTGSNGAPIEALTADGQKVSVELSARFQPEESELWKLHKEVGKDYVNKIVIPEIRSVVRTIVSQNNVMDVYSVKRREIQDTINQELLKTFGKYYIRLNELLIRNIRFSDEFQKAIEAKQVALQDAQRMQYVLQKEKQEKDRKIIAAQGEAESIRIRGQALNSNPRLIQYEYVQKIAPGIKAVVTNQNSIMNFGNFLDDKGN